ncbi:hypothetical protein [Cronobacter malonaticus]|uniref:hypothetical protein n=1 Tax=Cronobacter malonaticus TaxID=413503 RepID=UPI00289591A0|nr:hypothetical protein [Cronobacter malonaticus]MDT3624454.1 hypothetical protein [Cronobacter malonaticus]
MESHVAINFEEDFQSFCRKFEQRLKQTNERDGLTAVQIHSAVAAGEKWASEFFQKYGENEIESHYDAALTHEFEQLCLQADGDRTMTDSTDIATGLHTLGQAFWEMGRVREACRFLAIACGYLELNKDISIFYNLSLVTAENKKRDQRKSKARKGGVSKAHKLEPVRRKVMELLETTDRPPNGWATKELAFKAIDEPLRQFIETHDIKLDVSELRVRVLRWSREHDGIRGSFEKVIIREKNEK